MTEDGGAGAAGVAEGKEMQAPSAMTSINAAPALPHGAAVQASLRNAPLLISVSPGFPFPVCESPGSDQILVAIGVHRNPPVAGDDARGRQSC